MSYGPNDRLPDYNLDPSDDDLEEVCDTCGRLLHRCRCAWADRKNDEESIG